MYKLSKISKEFKEALFPSTCVICDNFITGDNSYFPFNKICKDCAPSLYFKQQGINSNPQSICFNCLEVKKTISCLLCDFSPLSYNKVFSLWPYSEKTEKVIYSYKYLQKFYLAKELSNMLFESFFKKESLYHLSLDYDYIIPVPSQNETIKERGFHHTILLARYLAKQIKSSSNGCKVLPLAFYFIKQSKRQALKEIKQRKKDSKLPIALSIEKAQFKNKKILIIDDVITTGNTAESCAKLLINTRQLDFLSLARSQNFIKNKLSS